MANFLTPRAFALPALLLGGLSLSACSVQGYDNGSRYSGANCDVVTAQNCAGYDAQYGAYGGQPYESYGGQSITKSRYGSLQSVTSYEQYTYAPQQVMLRPAPMTYQQPSYQAPSYNVELYNPTTTTPANCPAGTTAQADGTCLQGSSLSYSSAAVSTPSYSTSSSYSGGYITGGTTANCPAGTSAQSDGTCLEGASSSLSYSSSSYDSPSYSRSSTSLAPPISTQDFSDYNWGSKDTTWGTNGYVSPGTRTVDNPNSYPAAATPSHNFGSSYMPIRK